MSTVHRRATNGSKHVLVASDLFHRHGRNVGRQCDICGCHWTVEIDTNENFHVWRDGVSEDLAILDWIGKNVAIECCGS